MSEIEKLQKEIDKLKTENAKLKSDKKNLEHRVRNMKLAQKVAESKLVFSDHEKLMMVESVILAVIGSEAFEPMTRKLLSNLSDDDFWRENKNKDTDKILVLLAKK